MIRKNHIDKNTLKLIKKEKLVFLPIWTNNRIDYLAQKLFYAALCESYGKDLYLLIDKKFKDGNYGYCEKYGIYDKKGNCILPYEQHNDSDYRDGYLSYIDDSNCCVVFDAARKGQILHEPNVEKFKAITIKSDDSSVRFFIVKRKDTGLINVFSSNFVAKSEEDNAKLESDHITYDYCRQIIFDDDNITDWEILEQNSEICKWDKKSQCANHSYESIHGDRFNEGRYLILQSNNPPKGKNMITCYNSRGQVLYGENIRHLSRSKYHAPFIIEKEDNNKNCYGIICNNDSKFVMDTKVRKIVDLKRAAGKREDLFSCKLDNNITTFVDCYGNMLFESRYEDIYPFHDKANVTLAKIPNESRYELVDREGQVIKSKSPIIDVISEFKEYKVGIGSLFLALVEFEGNETNFIDVAGNKYVKKINSLDDMEYRFIRAD